MKVNNEDWKRNVFLFILYHTNLLLGYVKFLMAIEIIDGFHDGFTSTAAAVQAVAVFLPAAACIWLLEQICAVQAGAASLIQFLKRDVSRTTADIYCISVQYLEEHVDGCTVGVI